MIVALARPNIPYTSYDYALNVPSGYASGGTVTWFAQVFGTNGLSTDESCPGKYE